ncbi:hypothetical protein LCGC14_0950680 [marine sediment metagenome]|uniref:Uncharacterized protein n=1 Tax=marine sediment metagenome TaxID=412755 RepID=A0A0F9NHE4_9ZZZZ|nr:hypothetical protein [archaeon]HEC40795.1 hypothetical protein [bacterium]
MKFQNEKHQVVVKPYSTIRDAWVTHCPECGFIIKFAEEIGKKEQLFDPSLIKKLIGFKEFGNTYQYNYVPQEKPYMDFLDYYIEKVDNARSRIKSALAEIDFIHWGSPYQEWKHDRNVDAFKFLVKFYTNLEDYCQTRIEDPNNKDMDQKISELNLPEDLNNNMQDIRILRNQIVHEAYEITEEEEVKIEDTYIQFMYWLVSTYLRPLGLDKIKIEPEYTFLDITKINYEIREFLHLYLGSTLRIKNFYDKFLTPLLKELGIHIENSKSLD